LVTEFLPAAPKTPEILTSAIEKLRSTLVGALGDLRSSRFLKSISVAIVLPATLKRHPSALGDQIARKAHKRRPKFSAGGSGAPAGESWLMRALK